MWSGWPRANIKWHLTLEARAPHASPVPASHPHRMRDLVRLTGISAPTIHFYGQQGLLPEAHKTAGNQAQYAETTMSRLRWIRAMQNELRLSLRSIRSLLEQHGQIPVDDVQALMALGHL